MRIVALGIAISIVVGLLVVPAAVRAGTDKPTWQVGDYWVYKGNVPALAGSSGDTRMRLDVVGMESVVVDGTSYSTYHTKVGVNATMGSVTLNIPGDAWFRSSDLSPLKMKLVATIGTPPQSFEITITTTMSPPQEMRWPLTAGATWTVSDTVTGVVEITGQNPSTIVETVSGTVNVGASETLAVQAGSFEASPVTFTQSNGNQSKSYWSSRAGNYVEQKSYDPNGMETSSSELTAYHYAGPSAPSGFLGLGTILGLAWYIWVAAIVIALAAGGSVATVRRRRRRSKAPGPTPSMPPDSGSITEPGPPQEPPTPPP